MNITFFGSCSREIENRGTVSFLIEDLNTNFLVDCGSGCIQAIKKAKKNVHEIDNVLHTHVHGDHISDIAYFIWYRRFEKLGAKINKLNIYGQKDVLELTKYNVEHMYPGSNHLDGVNFIEIKDKSIFSCDCLKIQVFDVIHKVPCIGCKIESADGKKIAYSSDTLINEKLIPYFQNSDLLIHEGMFSKSETEFANKVKHCTAEEAGKIAKLSNAKALALVHIEPNVLGNEKELIEEARKEYSGLITIPIDGTVYNI